MGFSKEFSVTSFTLLFQSCFSAPTSTASSMLLPSQPTGLADAAHNNSALYVGYVSGPSGRGTLSLVVSCLSTLIICVWTALHLNVPPPRNNMVQKLLRFIKCVSLGVCFPELVGCTAWCERSFAKEQGEIIDRALRMYACALFLPDRQSNSISRAVDENIILEQGSNDQTIEMIEHSDREPPGSMKLGRLHSLHESENGRYATNRQAVREENSFQNGNIQPSLNTCALPKAEVQWRLNEWTMTHSLFAMSGGFVFDFEDQDLSMQEKEAADSFLPQDCPRRITITASGMAFLARCGHLPDISKAEIDDRSKANSIGKTLAIIQVSWMLIQVLGRLRSGLPVTLLELNTLAHVQVYLRP